LVEIQTAYYMMAATGVLIAAIYYVVNTRTTLQTRQAQLFMPIHSQFYSRDFIKAIQDIIFDYEWKDYEDFQMKYDRKANLEAYTSRMATASFFEGVGVLVKRRLIDASFVDDLMSGYIMRYWEKMNPIVNETRLRLKWPQYGEYIEYLYNQIKPIVERQNPELRK